MPAEIIQVRAMKLAYMLFLFLPLSISCKEKSCEDLFYEFVYKKNDDGYIVLETGSICPSDVLDKKYKKITADYGNTNYLLEKAASEDPTNYCIPNLVCPMTEGDIAICMLLDMYPMSDDCFENTMYENVKREYGSAADFWRYIHTSAENRNAIIRKIRNVIKNEAR